MYVEQIPFPWRHAEFQRVVVRAEYWADRPKVVDFVFADGTRFVETRHAKYWQDGDSWKPETICGARIWPYTENNMCVAVSHKGNHHDARGREFDNVRYIKKEQS